MFIHDPLLETKFAIPISPHALMTRPRLTTLLNQGLQRQLLLVSAPAGFGKTTLLAQWQKALSQKSVVTAWVTLDKGDNYLLSFWRYVLAAFNKCQEGIATEALDAVMAPQKPRIEYALTTFINTLATSNATWVLFLDNYQAITDPEIHDSLTFLLEHLPAHLHILLATRVDPPLPLARLRAGGQLLELRTEQLRCTPEEMTRFLNEVMDLSISQDLDAQSVASTEGWLVGLQLMGLWLKKQPYPHEALKALHGSHRYVFDYLMEEVLHQQSEEVQAFLLQTSLLERLSAPLCDAVTESSNSQEMLELLERNNLFIVALDENRCWYRYQSLFAETLRYRLEQSDVAQIHALHLKASRWYARKGAINEAINHALKAHAWDETAALLEPIIQRLLWKRCELPILWQWLQQLPQEVIRIHPYLGLAYAMILFLTASPEEAIPWLQTTQEAIAFHSPAYKDVSGDVLSQNASYEKLRGEVTALEAIITSYRGADTVTLDLCSQALTYLPEEDNNARATIFLAQSLAYFAQGRAVDATCCALKASSFAQEVGDIPGAICHRSIAAYYLLLRGRLQEAHNLLQQTYQLGSVPGNFSCSAIAWANMCHAEILREWNRLDEALALTSEGMPSEEQIELLILLSTGYMQSVRLYLSRNELDAADDVFQQKRKSPLQIDSADQLAWILAVEQVRLWIAHGELERASHWVQELEWRERPRSLFACEREGVAQARVLLAQHQPSEALGVLSFLLPHAQEMERWGNVLEMLILQALAYHMQQEEIQALSILAQAVRIAEPEGYIRIFVDEGAPMQFLLSRLKDIEQRPPHYLDTVLVAFQRGKETLSTGSQEPGTVSVIGISSGQCAEHKIMQSLAETLSTREIEVLQLMEKGKSNQEIAKDLVIATNTAKRHVSNIFIKLGVNSRLQAVARARELGLIL